MADFHFKDVGSKTSDEPLCRPSSVRHGNLYLDYLQDQASKDSRAAEGGEGTSDPQSKPLVPVMNQLPPRFRSV